MGLTILFGLPRSGTTWLGKIFDSHPNTLYRHEPDNRAMLGFLPKLSSQDAVDCSKQRLEAFAKALWSRTEEKVVDSVPLFPKAYFSSTTRVVRQAVVVGRKLAPRHIGMFPPSSFYEHLNGTGVHMVWKSIESLGRLGTCVKALPGARAVCILRHPGGFVSSTLRGERADKFDDGYRSADDLELFEQLVSARACQASGINMGDVRAMSPVERLALKWAVYCEHAQREVVGLPSVVTIRYEDLCANPLQISMRLFEHAGLSWNKQSEDFVALSISSERSGYYSVVKDPMRSAMKWQTELSQDDIARIQAVIRRFGVSAFYPE